MKIYLRHVLNLQIKDNYQIYPVDDRGIDFVGYKFYHTHILIRKSIKSKMFKLINKYKNKQIGKNELLIRMLAYFGWLKHCNSKNLLRKIEKETGLHFSNWNGEKLNISDFYNKVINIVEVVEHNTHFNINFIFCGKPYVVSSKSVKLYNSIKSSTNLNNYKLKKYV